MNSLVIAGHLIKRLIGRKKTLVTMFLLPAVIVAVIITQISVTNPNREPVAYVDLNHSALSASLVKELSAAFQLKEKPDAESVNEEVIRQHSSAGLVIPADFDRGVLEGGRANVEMVQLSMKENTVSLKLMLDSYLLSVSGSVETAKQAGLTGDRLKQAVESIAQQQAEHNVSAKETDLGLSVSPAFRVSMGMFLMFMLIMISNAVGLMLEDRQTFTMARMYTAPVRAWEIAVGNFLGSFAVGSLQVAFVLLVMHQVIGLDSNLAFLPHFVISELFLLVAIGIGTAAGAFIKNQNQFSSLLTLFITPTCMLGGCFWPVWMMEDYMQKIANFIPQKWALDAMETLATGADIGQVALHLGVLALFALVLIGIGSVVLRPSEREAA